MTLEALAELNIDDVRRDVERLERALRIARAVLRELTAPNDRAALDLTDDDVDTVAHRLEDRHGVTVRPSVETAPPRAEPPPPASPASQAPAAASTRRPRPSLATRVADYFAQRPHSWLVVDTVARALGATSSGVSNACRDLVRVGDLEHNGRRSKASRYRWRSTGAPPEEPPATGTLEPEADSSPASAPAAPRTAKLTRLTATAAPATPDQSNGSLEGRALDALSYQPATFDDLAARLGMRDTNSRGDLLRALIRLVRGDSIVATDQRPPVYRVTAA